MTLCACRHTKSSHLIRTMCTGRFSSYRRYMECGWKSCKCKKYTAQKKSVVEIIHYILWRKNSITGRYPVYLCNQAVRPAKGRTVVSHKVLAHRVTCKNCQRMLK